MLFLVVNEILIDKSKNPPKLVSAAEVTAKPSAYHQKETPEWLVPKKHIDTTCNHPWIISKELEIVNQSIDELFTLGLSECYRVLGKNGVQSHLWHQGIKKLNSISSFSEDEKISAAKVQLYLRYDANFTKLGVNPPITYRLSGYIVHDVNGDAVFNEGEPVIPGAKVCIIPDNFDPICRISDTSGKYHFERVIPGGWKFKLFSPISDKYNAFEYFNLLIEKDSYVGGFSINGYPVPQRYLNITQFHPIKNDTLLLIERDMDNDFFLMQEWATLYSSPRDSGDFQIQAYFDYDIRKDHTKIFNGYNGPTYDQHDGLDVSCSKGTEILSIAEGWAIAIFNESTVALRHANNLVSVYGHGLPLVQKDQFVPRGYPVALCDKFFTESDPHLHLGIWEYSPWLPDVIYTIPLYADTNIMETNWYSNPDPLDPNHRFVYVMHGGRGIWTEINQPHHAYMRFISE
jgi:murein DD-endopeptidase MepM/ murein hydrolase activator NlpD